MFLIDDNNVLFSNDDRVPQIYCYRLPKKCNFTIEYDIFDCRKCTFAVCKYFKKGNLPVEHEPTQLVHWLENRLVYFVVCWIYVYLLWRTSFFLSFYFYHLPIGIILLISWDKTLPMSPLTNYSQLMRFLLFLHRRIRRACAHAVSKEPPPAIYT